MVQFECFTEVPGLAMEPAMMFAHPTYLADTYRSLVERIYLPEETLPATKVNIKVSTRHTGENTSGTLAWRISRIGRKRMRGTQCLNLPEKYVFDARFDTDNNIFHVLQGIATPVLLAQKVLTERLNEAITIHVILRERACEMARQAYETLGIKVIYTDDDVYANVVEISPLFPLYSVQPELFNIDIKNYQPNTPERIFVSRKGSRRIINNDEVSSFLSSKGFTTCYFEDMTPSEEWSVTRNAKVVVINHGAGVANLIFNRQGIDSPVPNSGIRIIEIFSPCYTFPGVRHLATLLNGKWCGVRGQITPEVVKYLDFGTKRDSLKSPIKDPFKVSLETLELALGHLDVDK